MTDLQKKWVRAALKNLVEEKEGCAESVRERWCDDDPEKDKAIARYTSEAKEIRQVIKELGV